MKLDINTQIAHGSPESLGAALADMGVSLPLNILEDFASPAGLALVVRKRDGSCSALTRSGQVRWDEKLPSNVAAILYTTDCAKVIRIKDEAT